MKRFHKKWQVSVSFKGWKSDLLKHLRALSNLSLAKRLLQGRWQEGSWPSTRWWPENIPSWHHSQAHTCSGLQEAWPLETERDLVKDVGASDVHTRTRLKKAVWAKGIRAASYCICVCLSGKEDEDSPDKVYMFLIMYVTIKKKKNP